MGMMHVCVHAYVSFVMVRVGAGGKGVHKSCDDEAGKVKKRAKAEVEV